MKTLQYKEIKTWKINRHDSVRAVDAQECRSTKTNYNHTIQGDTTMSTYSTFFRFGIAIAMVALLSVSQQSFAAGTLAGTTISNTATVQYNAGVNVRTGTSNTITMTVGYKVSINLSASSSNTTTVDSTILYKYFNFTNTGNYPDNFAVSVGHFPTNWTVSLYKDINASGTWDGGDSLFTSGGALYLDTVSVTHNIGIIAKIVVPQGTDAPDNLIDSVTVYVESNGAGPGGVVRVGGAGRQVHFANITIAKPVISISGAQNPSSPSAAQRIPGSTFTYTVSLQNTGHRAIENGATFTFKLDNDFRFTSADGSGANSGQDGNGNGGTVTWTLGATDLSASMGAAITRQVVVTIEQVTANGTGATVGNTVTIMDSTASPSTTSQLIYGDGLHVWSKGTAALTSFTVSQASGAYVRQITANQNGNPGDSLTYTLNILNRGNGAMTFTMNQAVSGGDLDTVHLFTATPGGAGSQPFVTASIPAGDSLTVYAYLIVNVTGQNGNTIIRLLSAAPGTAGTTPNGAGNYNPSVTVTTTVTAPNLSIVLSQAFISGTGDITNPAPGDVIEYTLLITNNGTGTATNLSTSNAIPSNTTFATDSYGVGQGIQVDGSAKTNIADADGATYSANTVTAGPFTVAAAGTKTIKYRVTIN